MKEVHGYGKIVERRKCVGYNDTVCEMDDGSCELIRKDEILKALKMMNKSKAWELY